MPKIFLKPVGFLYLMIYNYWSLNREFCALELYLWQRSKLNIWMFFCQWGNCAYWCYYLYCLIPCTFVSSMSFSPLYLLNCAVHFANNCIFEFMQEQIASRVSSIFLRMLFLPDIFHNSVLRATLQDHNKHFTDSEFHSLIADGLKKEIISLIEHEVWTEKDISNFISVIIVMVFVRGVKNGWVVWVW